MTNDEMLNDVVAWLKLKDIELPHRMYSQCLTVIEVMRAELIVMSGELKEHERVNQALRRGDKP